MYERKVITEAAGKIQKVFIYQDKKQLSFSQIFDLWQFDQPFRDFFIELLKNVDYEAFRWETPAVNKRNMDQGFEFMILDSPYLALPANPQPFREYILEQNRDKEVVVFQNLGKDATMIVPTPMGRMDAYAHMAAFLRYAASSQVHALWMTIGKIMKEEISDKNIWLNTAGGGVAWLHVRLDSRPKYYGYAPYRGAF